MAEIKPSDIPDFSKISTVEEARVVLYECEPLIHTLLGTADQAVSGLSSVFKRVNADSKVVESLEDDKSFLASCCSYSMLLGFENRTSYTLPVFSNFISLMQKYIHENIHAAQNITIPVIHACLQNHNAEIVLAPRDTVLLDNLCEKAAYAMENHAMASIIGNNSGLFQHFFSEPILPFDPDDFDLSDAYNRIAESTMETEKLICGQMQTMSTHYALNKIADYKRTMTVRKDFGTIKNPEFVRLESDDLTHFVDVFWGDVPECVFSQEIEIALEALNSSIGIVDEQDLPTFREALADRGLTPEEFMARNIKDHSYKPQAFDL